MAILVVFFCGITVTCGKKNGRLTERRETEFVPFNGILFQIIWFEINGEELTLCELLYCLE